MKTRELSNSQKDQKKNTFRYYGKTGHVDKTYWNKRTDFEEKFKQLEGDVVVVHLTSWSASEFTFNIGTSQVLLAQTSQNE